MRTFWAIIAVLVVAAGVMLLRSSPASSKDTTESTPPSSNTAEAAPLVAASAPPGTETASTFAPPANDPAALARDQLAGRTVRDVQLSGFVRTPHEIALNTIRTRAGSPLDNDTVREDVGRLNRLAHFSSIVAKAVPNSDGTVQMIYEAVEAPIIIEDAQLEADFLIDPKTIAGIISPLKGAVADEKTVLGARDALLELFRSRNHPNAIVRVDRSRLDEGVLRFVASYSGPASASTAADAPGVDSTTTIEQTTQSPAAQIIFASPALSPLASGSTSAAQQSNATPVSLETMANRPVRDVRLIGFAGTPEDSSLHKLVFQIIRTKPESALNVETVREDVSRLNRLGRFSSVVARATPLSDGTVQLVYEVVEPPVIRDAQVEANFDASSEDVDRVVNLLVGTPVDDFQIGAGKDALLKFFHSNGHPKATIEVDRKLLETGSLVYVATDPALPANPKADSDQGAAAQADPARTSPTSPESKVAAALAGTPPAPPKPETPASSTAKPSVPAAPHDPTSTTVAPAKPAGANDDSMPSLDDLLNPNSTPTPAPASKPADAFKPADAPRPTEAAKPADAPQPAAATPKPADAPKAPNSAAATAISTTPAIPATSATPSPASDPSQVKLVPQDDGSTLVDDKYVMKGAGTKGDPYRITWEMLTSTELTYQPRLGRKVIPGRVKMLDGKWVRISGYIAFPVMAESPDEMLMMLNQWDGCCIGVPPTPYDAIEVKLKDAAKGDTRLKTTGTLTGILRVDPYLVKDWLVSLFVMDSGEIGDTAGAAQPGKHAK